VAQEGTQYPNVVHGSAAELSSWSEWTESLPTIMWLRWEPSGDGDAEAPPSVGSHVELIRGVLDHGSKRWQPATGRSHEDST
jgi:hypothetical protein